ncbi:DUF2905 family protein [Bacillus carboniphilus]|uniref:DUF2905 family protein n=1 Tax=Bacillus carboniphilus TaxID=86663 RepID=A0ABY9JXG6_9BACI|nr:DUF2905 family protein [Bacillus carboniphilus]WLR44064.1 DUF2905 family protein [Bacillus carboniphilus]
MMEIPKILMLVGVVFLALGILLQLIGKVPGDILFKKGNTTFFFPIVSCIIISIILSVILSLLSRFK